MMALDALFLRQEIDRTAGFLEVSPLTAGLGA
jgi:hypothetical protein